MRRYEGTERVPPGSLRWFVLDRHAYLEDPDPRLDEPFLLPLGLAWSMTRPGGWLWRRWRNLLYRLSSNRECGCRLMWWGRPLAVTFDCPDHGFKRLLHDRTAS